MAEIDWDKVERGQRGTRKPNTYASHTCPLCGKTIREGAWGSKASNWKKHCEAHERRGELPA